MKFSKSNALLVFFISLALILNVSAQSSDEVDIEAKVERLLQKRDVGELANELARNKSGSTEDFLIKLSVFARAGHRVRVQETLREVGKIYSSSPDQYPIFKIVRRAVGSGDLAAQKIFYEQFAVNGDDRAKEFFNLCKEQGDLREFEKWLRVRAQDNELWWNYWVEAKKSLGEKNEVADELAQKIRENPTDYSLVKKYLQVVSTPYWTSIMIESPIVSYERYGQDVSWLAEVVKTDSAYQAFDLAILLQASSPLIAARLLEKSLSTPYTETDAKLLGERALRGASISPNIKNPEKQLRVWTKKALVEIYRATNQALLAQPIVEELTPMDMSDIQPDNAFFSAGAVQSVTGRRVVETKILQDETANENSPQYWLNRAKYYKGRREKDSVRQTFIQALGKFQYKPNDWQASLPRLQILHDLKWFDGEIDEKETEQILRKDFINAMSANDPAYLFQLSILISDDFEDLSDEFFTNTELLPQILSVREHWGDEEKILIRNVLESEKWSAKKRDFVWNRLADMAKSNVRRRAFSLAGAMTDEDEYRRAVPLLEECSKIAPKEYVGSIDFTRREVDYELFNAYNAVGDWRKAEKMYLNGFRNNDYELGLIALSAAKKGDIADALRIWKLNANLDRRNLNGLENLAKTGAKTSLSDFYLTMKRTDVLSDAAEKALLMLK